MARTKATRAMFLVLLAAMPAGLPPADAQEAAPAQAAQANLTFQKFPAEFADYYTTQRLLAKPTEPQPFCKSAAPLLCSGGPFALKAILDESGGTGTGYDTLYVDTVGDGEFTDPVTYKVAPIERKTGLGGRPLVGYFDNVGIPRGQSDGPGPRAQIFVEHDPAGAGGTDYVVNLIPAQWAVGTIEVNGQPVPVAMVDGTWNGSVADRGGANPEKINQMAPGDDAQVMRGDYIILGKSGQTQLEPGDPNGWLGQGGSARALNARHLVLDSGTYEVQADQVGAGVNLQLVPANVPMTTVDLSQVPHAGRFAMFGANTSVVLDNPAGAIQLPADTYYVPAFGAYTADVPESGNVALPPAADLDASGAQTYAPLPDREQRLFAAEPPGGVVDWSQPQTSPFAFATGRPWQNMELLVVSAETGRPIGKAKVSVYSYTGGWPFGSSGSRDLATDAIGRCTIRLPVAGAQYVNIEVSAPRFVPTYKAWNCQYGEPIPERYTWPLEPGTTIGGTVRDERDRPIRDVRVCIRTPPLPAASGRPELASWLLEVRTDRQGKWKCDAVPARERQLGFLLVHPDYISDDDAVRSAPIEQLRDLAAAFVMKKGITLEGKVIGPAGTPVKNTALWIGQPWPSTSVLTDRQGRYRFRNLKAGETNVLVRAPGCAPDLKKVTVEENMRPVDFKLEEGRTLKGRVVDENGDPIAGAQAYLQQWRGGFFLQWHARTDSEGRFRWTEAPIDAVSLSIDAQGRRGTYETLVAGPDEHVIVLKKRIRITGRVVDAASGQPIPSFRAITGINRGDGTIWWLRYDAVKGTNGVLAMEPDVSRDQVWVRIEADGYLPAVSDAQGTVPPQTIEFALTRGEDVAGVVLDPDDQPVTDAQVVVTTPSDPARIQTGRFNLDFGGVCTGTDSEGRFHLPPQIDAYTLMATHDRGFGLIGQAGFEKSHRIRLEPWGRIEGTARRRGQTIGAQRFWLSSSEYRGTTDFPASFSYSPVTDEAGRFTVERMIPGIHSIRWGDSSDTRYQLRCHRSIEVTPGQICRLDFEEPGRPVTGRLQATASPGRKIVWENSNVSLQRLRQWPKVPASLPAGSPALQAWCDGWLRSDKGREYRLAGRWYEFNATDDGAFEIPNVPPGRYVLYAYLWERGATDRAEGWAGTALQEFDVRASDIPSDTPLDLGAIPVKRARQIKTGQPAPPLTCKTLDGGSLNLNHLRGKYVLLGFWASWNVSEHQVDRFKNIQKMYGLDDRLAIVTVSLDQRAEDAKNYALLKGMTWTQGFPGEWAKTSIPGDYNVSWLPSDVLIGPDGRILAGSAVGVDPRAELIKALGKPAAATQAAPPTGPGTATQASNER
jgi:protocatechuate 3,4-dioxygenase beta subunit